MSFHLNLTRCRPLLRARFASWMLQVLDNACCGGTLDVSDAANATDQDQVSVRSLDLGVATVVGVVI